MIVANYDLKITDLMQCLDYKHKSVKLNLKYLENFFDICMFNTMASLDLDVALDGFFNSKHNWQKRFYARSLILILNEHLEKIHVLMNSKFYRFISSSFIFEELKDEIIVSKKRYKELNKKKLNLEKLRNNIIGHRNSDAELFYNTINEIKLEEILDLAIETQTILNQFTLLSTKVVKIIIDRFDEFYKEMKS